MTTLETSDPGTTRTGHVSLAAHVATGGSLLAALVHYVAMRGHLDEWWLSAAFFSALALFQLVWAVLVHTGDERPMLLSGLAVNAGVIALWAVTRTAGLPFGPEAGEAEAIGVPDVLSAVAEAAVVVAVLAMLPGRRKKTEPDA
ncbi:hypothetical protein [Actinomadura formosensis]|uniref:hypothetical protein n=1 Tax=Actinomadura formosensis TaxID=60706 RepID=UPI003D8D0A32